jgi:flagellar hook-associated protein 3 FlgL
MAMRITNQMLSDDAVRQLQANLSRLAQSQEQVSTNRRINRPSDDPVQTGAAITLRDSISELTQYQRNIDLADGKLAATDGALGAAGDLLQRARELALQGATGSLSASDRQTIGLEVDQLIGGLLAQAQAKSAGAYLFSGFRTDTAPYATAAGAYQGDAGAVMARIGPGSTVQVNVTADVAFGPALQALVALQAELAAGTPVTGATIDAVDAGLDAILGARGLTGARQNRLAQTRASLDDGILAATQLQSTIEDVDMAKAITDMSNRQASYEAALRVNARLLQTSLFDLMR